MTIILSNLLVNTVTFLALYEDNISGSNPDVVSLQNILFATFFSISALLFVQLSQYEVKWDTSFITIRQPGNKMTN